MTAGLVARIISLLMYFFYKNSVIISIENSKFLYTHTLAGLVVSHGGQVPFQTIDSPVKLEGFIDIFGRLLNCSVVVMDEPRSVNIVTENSPAPLLFAKGEIIVQKNKESSLQGPQIVAYIDSRRSDVSIRGFVKVKEMFTSLCQQPTGADMVTW